MHRLDNYDQLSEKKDETAFANHNILIVDDMPINLGVIVTFLQDAGFGIRIARSGESALRRVQYDHPDIILLDVLMPGMDGFETCRRLKMNEATKDIPVIFMTSLTRVEDKVRGFEVGAVDYVTKPLAQEEVLARVTTHLRLLTLTNSLKAQNEQLKVTSEAEMARLFAAVSQQRQQLRTLTRRLTEVQELERKQIARELHDEMGQALTAISINLAAIETAVSQNNTDNIQERLQESKELAALTLEQMRELSVNLRPPMLDELGLLPTLKWYVKRYRLRTNIQATLKVMGEERRLPASIETAVYRIVQEALTNIVKHAEATAVRLNLHLQSDGIFMQIKDNGQGFNLEEALQKTVSGLGAGLLGIRERVTLLGGNFDIDTSPDDGVTVTVFLPDKKEPERDQ